MPLEELSTNVWYYAHEAMTRSSNVVKSKDDVLHLFDFNANLTHEDLQNDLKVLIEQAAIVGVEEMLVPGATIQESHQAIALCSQYPTKLFPTAGVHPYYATSMPCTKVLATLQSLVELDHVRAVGECGLDYSPNFPNPEYQKKWFAEQLALACTLKKPLFLHERQAHHDFIQLVDEATQRSDGYFPPAVVHCFTGNEKELKTYIARGDDWYIGITGFICKKQGAALRDIIKHVPLNRLVLETDAPYMGFPNCRRAELHGIKKQYPNVPSAMPLVAQAVASALGLSPQEIATITRANARRFLRL